MKNEILSLLSPDYPWGELLQWFDTIDSTNDRLKELARRGAPHGTVLAAGHQTGGHGRMGRSFQSPAGMGVYLSILLRPDCPPTQLMHLTCATAVAMCDAVENATGLRPGIKWTNDLVHEKRKLGGILTELGLGPRGNTDYAIIGIGLNCCQQQEDFDPELRDIAASLSMVTGRPVDPVQLAAAMLKALRKMDASLLTGREEMLRRYRKDCVTLGSPVCVIRSDTVRYGTALDVDDEGALVVAFSTGETEAVNSGEVSVRGMYGYI